MLESVISQAWIVEEQYQWRVRTSRGRAPLGDHCPTGLFSSNCMDAGCTDCFHDSLQGEMTFHILSLEDFAPFVI